ncbi:hypothetical protein KC842_03035 [Candidatus Nomurabacteria bacterium]|nr:hypothetical protein [Candidatus Nomurabacteria bacterium]
MKINLSFKKQGQKTKKIKPFKKEDPFRREDPKIVWGVVLSASFILIAGFMFFGYKSYEDKVNFVYDSDLLEEDIIVSIDGDKLEKTLGIFEDREIERTAIYESIDKEVDPSL